jgi:hypothetical protein
MRLRCLAGHGIGPAAELEKGGRFDIDEVEGE